MYIIKIKHYLYALKLYVVNLTVKNTLCITLYYILIISQLFERRCHIKISYYISQKYFAFLFTFR